MNGSNRNLRGSSTNSHRLKFGNGSGYPCKHALPLYSTFSPVIRTLLQSIPDSQKKINFIKHFIKIKKNPGNSEEKDCKNWKEYTDRPAHPTLRVRLPLCRHSVSMEGRSSFQIHRFFSLHTHTLCSVFTIYCVGGRLVTHIPSFCFVGHLFWFVHRLHKRNVFFLV